jgi:hypothetical protein
LPIGNSTFTRPDSSVLLAKALLINQQTAGGVMKKKSTAKKMDDSARRIENTLEEIVETVEKYFDVAPFDFILGTDSEGSYRLFDQLNNKPPHLNNSAWNMKWMCALIPRTQHTLRKLENQHEFSDETMDLCFDSQQFGFALGVLVGMKTMGASKHELLRRSQGFSYTAFDYDPSLDIEEEKAKK